MYHYETKALLSVSSMNLLFTIYKPTDLYTHSSCIADEDLWVETSRISKFMLLMFNKALFLSMCVHFPCVHIYIYIYILYIFP